MEMKRIERVLQAMESKGLTQMIVCDPQSIDYLTGVYIEPFERLFALYLRTDGQHIFFLNKLFITTFPILKVAIALTYLSVQLMHGSIVSTIIGTSASSQPCSILTRDGIFMLVGVLTRILSKNLESAPFA